MISIRKKITKDLKDWYFREMIEKLKENQSKGKVDLNLEYDKDLRNGVHSMDEAFFRILLTGSQKELRETYQWVNDYAAFCDMAADLLWIKKKQEEKLLAVIKAYVSSSNNPYLKEAIQRAFRKYKRVKKESFPDSKAQAQCLYRVLLEVLEEVNDSIRPYIDYDLMNDKKDRTKTVRHELLYRMDVKVCPYCNRNVITTLRYANREKEKKYLPMADLDHLLPKSVYQLYSLSLWNFIPSCKPCNQIMKKDKTCKLLPLAERGFEKDCSFQLHTIDRNGKGSVASLLGFGEETYGHWEVLADSAYSSEIQNHIEMFLLDQEYELEGIKIQDILRKRYIEGEFHVLLSKTLHEKNPAIPILSRKEINRMLYGSSLDPEQFVDEPLSKMTYDLLKKKQGSFDNM